MLVKRKAREVVEVKKPETPKEERLRIYRTAIAEMEKDREELDGAVQFLQRRIQQLESTADGERGIDVENTVSVNLLVREPLAHATFYNVATPSEE